jgi:four helix bundle protein
MLNKWKIVEEEADETLFWLELLLEAGILPETKLRPLMNEVDEILAMLVASIRTLRAHERS